MTRLTWTLCLIAAAGLFGCAGSPPVRYFSLDDGLPTTLGADGGPRIAITQVNLPDLIDRPQLVMRVAENQLKVSDQDRWGEPLRRQLPRLLARDVGVALGSGRVVALPFDAERFDVDFKVTVDIQRLDVVAGRWVEFDAIWRVEPRDGPTFFGRSLAWEPIADPQAADPYANAVAAQRKVLGNLAGHIATRIADWMQASAGKAGASNGGQVPFEAHEGSIERDSSSNRFR